MHTLFDLGIFLQSLSKATDNCNKYLKADNCRDVIVNFQETAKIGSRVRDC